MELVGTFSHQFKRVLGWGSAVKSSGLERSFTGVDWNIVWVTLALVFIGVVVIQSATVAEATLEVSPFAISQLVMGAVGVVAMLALAIPNYRYFDHPLWAWGFYLFSLAMLVYTMFFGVIVNGARRWIFLGPIRFQPAEISKICMIMFLAWWFARIARERLPWWHCITPAVLTMIPAILIKKQPDLDTALSLLGVLGGMVLVRGFNLKLISALLIGGMATAYFTVDVWLPKLDNHQIERFVALWNPEAHKKGAAYQQIQGTIAVGSGRFFGKGFGNGTQHRLKFLPEKHTDFIFAVLAEDWGFAGIALTMGLFVALLLLSTNVMLRCEDPFGILIIVGVLMQIFLQVFQNTAMIVGLTPVTGIPLPFVSYGRTSLIVTLASVGLILNVGRYTLVRKAFK